MRWIEGDTVVVRDHEEARMALNSRFPNVMRWLLGGRECGVLYGDQIGAIINGEELEYIDPEELPAEADASEIRAALRFMISNWVDARQPHGFGWEEWNTIWEALRYCAEEIGYLPNTKKMDALRDNSQVLSGRLLSEGYIRSVGNADDLNLGEYPFYDHDWVAILRACQYAYQNMPRDNPKFAEIVEALESTTPELLHRIKHSESEKFRSYGWKELRIHKRLNEIEIAPWDYEKTWEETRDIYRKFRREHQNDDREEKHDKLRVLRFLLKDNVEIKVYDKNGKFKEVTNSGEGEYVSYRDHDMQPPQIDSDVFIFGCGIQDRLVVATDDVIISESEICLIGPEQMVEWMEFVYANFPVKRYEPKKERE
jgi:hypothetical protein